MKSKGNVKATMIEMLEALPDDCTWEDIQYHIYVRQKVERAMADIQTGNVLSQEEMERRMCALMKKWL
jgi:hypothetical protein